ncbi:MAG: hypothetical protein K2G90_01355 [Muribaculaceae bacterium]|nr:hypothetical protein [Muribaculaceae bacterium]
MRTLLLLPFLICLCLNVLNENTTGCKEIQKNPATHEDSIIKFIEYHKTVHPYSHYRDIYKSFMQDYYGPGHLLLNTEKSKAYLKDELARGCVFGGALYEPTGFEGNFIRVNLSLLKDSVIALDTFFEIFAKSAQGVVPPSDDRWIKEWLTVDSLMQAHNFHYNNEETERKEIINRLKTGNFVVHHSQAFNDSSNFHYRIISKDLFESDILPLIIKTTKQ